jgi:hypothetical protein
VKPLSGLLGGIVFLTSSTSLLFATTYYVSPAGRDSNNGTSTTSPWATIAKVDKTSFKAGDSILFLGGSTFSGAIIGIGGTSTTPITYSSYGTGRATISAGTGAGFTASGQSGLVVSNLNFSGSGSSSNAASGINLIGSSNTTIDSCDVGGFNDDGIGIAAGTAGASNVSVTNCTVHDCGYSGLEVKGNWDNSGTGTTYSNSNIYIGDCTVWNIVGRTNGEAHTGNGILLWDVSNSTVEGCVVHDCGVNNTNGSGPVGIWCTQASNILFQYNESYHNLTNSIDGDGFDFDGGTVNSTSQYNYAHDNSGAGILSWEFTGARPMHSNTFRYNICQNDATHNTFYSELTIGGGTEPGVLIYNNTFYSGISAALDGGTLGTGSSIRNNLLITTNGRTLLAGYGSATVQGNDYWSSGAAENIAGYSTLNAFSAATGQEMLSGQATGYELDPRLNDAGGGSTMGNPDLLDTLTAYQFQQSSPLVLAGLNLQSLFGINPGTQDFFGVAIPSSGPCSIGASEYNGTLPSPPTAPAGLAATVVTAGIDLAWTGNSTNESGFQILRSTDGVNFSVEAVTTANVTAYDDTAVAASTTYYYQVEAYNSNGNSTPSNTVSATTAPATISTTVILDVSSLTGVTTTGSWKQSTSPAGYYGNYYIDAKAGGGRSVKFTPNLPSAGTYQVYARWTVAKNRATNAPISIASTSGVTSLKVNQQTNGAQWVLLGTYAFNAGTGGGVTIGTTGANGYVIADAVEFVLQ